MRRSLPTFLASALAIFAVAANPAAADPWWNAHQSQQQIAAVCFTPGGDCTGVVVHEIDTARQTVLVQAYSFTSPPIAESLVRAAKRGVKVNVVLDKSQRTERYSGATYLANNGIPVAIDDRHAIAHNKVMVIDAATEISGSFNFTRSAQERNAENLLVIRDPAIAVLYTKNWQDHAGHSAPYQ